MDALNPLADPLGLLRALYACAVARALPADVTAAHLPPPPDPAKGRTLVLGAGKAGGAMAAAVDALWPADAPISGLVVTRYTMCRRPTGTGRAASTSSRPATRCPTKPAARRRSASPAWPGG